MVTIVNFNQRINAEGKEFFTLTLQGDIELIKSSQTGKFYASAKRASITSTFDERTCKSLLGKTLEGKIIKVETEPYVFQIPNSNETATLNHKYEYQPMQGAEEA